MALAVIGGSLLIFFIIYLISVLTNRPITLNLGPFKLNSARSNQTIDKTAKIQEFIDMISKKQKGLPDMWQLSSLLAVMIVAYLVYLFGLAGLIALVMISDAIGQVVSDDVTTDELLAKAPATLGLLMMAAIAVGLRGGAEGGPISVESADVGHLLMAPIDRRMVLVRPISQRMRSVAFGLAVAAGVIGQLVAR